MRCIVIHGFNVSDGGKGTVGAIIEYAQGAGVNAELFSYPWVFLFRLKRATDKAADKLIEQAGGQVVDVMAHSHGNVVVIRAIQRGLNVRRWVAVQPALKTDTIFPASVQRIDVVYNSGDKTMIWARIWRKIANAMPWRDDDPHMWGRMGLLGPKTQDGVRVFGHKINSGYGHSGMFANVGMLRYIASLMAGPE